MSGIVKYRYALIWALIILGLCGMNGNNLPQISFDIGIDKIAHFIFFGVQAYLIYIPGRKNLGTAILIAILFGISIEYLQMTVFMNRSFDYADMLADAVGALAVYPVVKILAKSKA